MRQNATDMADELQRVEQLTPMEIAALEIMIDFMISHRSDKSSASITFHVNNGNVEKTEERSFKNLRTMVKL